MIGIIRSIGLFGFFFQCFVPFLQADEIWKLTKINLTEFPNAKCLDGSPGGFWFVPGYGDGIDKFMIHHQGGGWCLDIYDCQERGTTDLGSSSSWEEVSNCDEGSQAQPCVYDGNEGLTGFDPTTNPLAYNWNKVFIGYCDGGSYAGHVAHPVTVPGTTNEVIHFKGRYILDALYDTLLTEFGMNNASAVIISGTSAGGLAVYLHADYLNEKITKQSIASSTPRITAVPDAGYFMNLPSITGDYLYTPYYQSIFAMQQVADSVDSGCIQFYSNTNETWKCFFAEYTLPFITTETFIVNSFVDSWQGYNIMGIYCNPTIPNDCSAEVVPYLNDFRKKILTESALGVFIKRPNAGAWLCECWEHPLLNWDYYWNYVEVQGWTLGKVLYNWYYRNADAGPWVVMDGEWGSNKC